MHFKLTLKIKYLCQLRKPWSLLCEKEGGLIGLGIWTTGGSGRLSNFNLGMTGTCRSPSVRRMAARRRWHLLQEGGPLIGPTTAWRGDLTGNRLSVWRKHPREFTRGLIAIRFLHCSCVPAIVNCDACYDYGPGLRVVRNLV